MRNLEGDLARGVAGTPGSGQDTGNGWDAVETPKHVCRMIFRCSGGQGPCRASGLSVNPRPAASDTPESWQKVQVCGIQGLRVGPRIRALSPGDVHEAVPKGSQ